MSKFIGFTTSIPIEVLFAASYIPIDLNNYFINSKDSQSLVDLAEQQGFPRNCCSWIKGIYTSAIKSGAGTVIGVMEGDCSQTKILCQVLEQKGIEVIPFCYPHDRNVIFLEKEIDKLRYRLDISWEKVNETKAYLDEIRRKVAIIDEATWKKNLVHGLDNHLFLISCSDMKGDPESFEKEIDNFLLNINDMPPLHESIRLGFIGVPPIFSDIYEICESFNGRVVFNEIQRQFSMPYESKDIKDQYVKFTYPYAIKWRIADVENEIRNRNLDGLIHYYQSFCFRNLEDIIFRHDLTVPVLSIEGDYPGKIDARTKIRIESFIEMLTEQKGMR